MEHLWAARIAFPRPNHEIYLSDSAARANTPGLGQSCGTGSAKHRAVSEFRLHDAFRVTLPDVTTCKRAIALIQGAEKPILGLPDGWRLMAERPYFSSLLVVSGGHLAE